MSIQLSEEEYRYHVDQQDGFCTECQEITRLGDTEPDAREYLCPDCQQLTCMGMEEALQEGEVQLI